jgi:enoyl-CoA hydratase
MEEKEERALAGGKILMRREGAVGTVVFNQPEKHNALSLAMWHGLTAALDAFAAEDGVRAVILRGAGERAFVSGADISEFEGRRQDAEAQKLYDAETRAARARLAAFPKPLIAAIRGYCLGGGLALALLADLRIAAADAVFGIPAARLGLAYGVEMTARLVATVGHAWARYLLMTAERIDAAAAERIGLVHRVVPAERWESEAAALAAGIAARAPLSQRAAKIVIETLIAPPEGRDFGPAERAVAACFDSADYREGREAFREKRPPRFVGR